MPIKESKTWKKFIGFEEQGKTLTLHCDADIDD